MSTERVAVTGDVIGVLRDSYGATEIYYYNEYGDNIGLVNYEDVPHVIYLHERPAVISSEEIGDTKTTEIDIVASYIGDDVEAIIKYNNCYGIYRDFNFGMAEKADTEFKEFEVCSIYDIDTDLIEDTEYDDNDIVMAILSLY